MKKIEALKILLIDDELFELKLLMHQLARLGFTEVRSCQHAHDALEVLEQDPKNIDLVICDLQMPQMDGVEFLRHLARIGYAGGLLLISGEERCILQSAERLAKAHSLDVNGSLCKPVRPEKLQQLLEDKQTRDATSHHRSWTRRVAAGHQGRRADQLLPTKGVNRHR